MFVYWRVPYFLAILLVFFPNPAHFLAHRHMSHMRVVWKMSVSLQNGCFVATGTILTMMINHCSLSDFGPVSMFSQTLLNHESKAINLLWLSPAGSPALMIQMIQHSSGWSERRCPRKPNKRSRHQTWHHTWLYGKYTMAKTIIKIRIIYLKKTHHKI